MRTLITGGLVVDATGREPLRNGAVLLEDGRIRAVGCAADFGQSEPGTHIVNASGCTVLPGLIDTHVHVMHEPQLLKLPAGGNALWGANYVQTAFQGGVTTMRDLGAQTDEIFGLKRALKEGWMVGPRLLVAGKAICMTGGHGWMNLAAEADNPAGVRTLARQQIRAGADAIKLMATGGAGTPGELPTQCQLMEDEMRAAVEVAHAAGRPVAAHAHAADGIKNALRAGVDSIEHGVFVDDEAIEMMLKWDRYLTPTLSVYPRIIERGKAGGEPDYIVEKSLPLREPHFENAQRAIAAGVKIALGSDSATLYNPVGDIALELELLVQAGMSARAAIESATRVAAESCRIAEEVGTLTPGKCADVLVVRGDALDDIRCVGAVCQVYRAGVLVHDERGSAVPGRAAPPIKRLAPSVL